MFNETSTLGADCGPGRVLQQGACVCLPGSQWYGTNQCVVSGSGPVAFTPPTGLTPADYQACLDYIAKYRRVYGRDPLGVNCVLRQPTPPVVFEPGPARQAPVVDVYPGPPTPPSTGYVHRIHAHRPPRPRVKQPTVERTDGELCPTWGYVSRPIPGVPEYQNFRCTPGRPVVIDPGLQAVGAAEARRRHGMGDLSGFTIAGFTLPDWFPVVAIGAAVLFLLKSKRR